MVALVMLFCLNAGLQTLSVLSVLPVVQVMFGADVTAGSTWLARLYEMLDVSGRRQFVFLLAFCSMGLITGSAASNVLSAYLIRVWIVKRQVRLAMELLDRCLTAPYTWHLSRNATKISRFFYDDVSMWSRGFLFRGLSIMGEGLTVIVAILAVMLVSGLPAVVVAITLGGIGFLATRAIRPNLLRIGRRKRLGLQDALVTAQQAFQGIRDVILSSGWRQFAESFEQPYRTAAGTNTQLQMWQMIPNTLLRVVTQGGMIVFVLVLWLSEVDLERASTLAVSLYLIASRVSPAVSLISTSAGALVTSLPYVEAIREVDESLQDAANGVERTREVRLPDDWKRIILEDVSYTYEGANSPALSGVSVTLKKGEMHGVVGRSAAGKTTLLDVLVGLLEPTRGTVRIDEIVVSASGSEGLQRFVGYVSQSPFFIDDTVRANVAFGMADDGNEAVWKALRTAQLADWAAALSEGIDTRIGDRGVAMSGGQRQRLAIARALFRNPEILILDEATSALDTITESEIMRDLVSLRGTVTIIIITHRIQTVAQCDNILLLEGGEIVGRGSYDELIEGSELFKSMAADRASSTCFSSSSSPIAGSSDG